jgi:hypothetical protein
MVPVEKTQWEKPVPLTTITKPKPETETETRKCPSREGNTTSCIVGCPPPHPLLSSTYLCVVLLYRGDGIPCPTRSCISGMSVGNHDRRRSKLRPVASQRSEPRRSCEYALLPSTRSRPPIKRNPKTRLHAQTEELTFPNPENIVPSLAP